MVCVCKMTDFWICKVEALNGSCKLWCGLAHWIIMQRCENFIYASSWSDPSRVFPPTWIPRLARALWTSWAERQAAVIQQKWLWVVTAGWKAESHHRCARFARHPVLSRISLPKQRWKSTVGVTRPQTSALEFQLGGWESHSQRHLWGQTDPSLPGRRKVYKVKQRGEVLTNQKPTQDE